MKKLLREFLGVITILAVIFIMLYSMAYIFGMGFTAGSN